MILRESSKLIANQKASLPSYQAIIRTLSSSSDAPPKDSTPNNSKQQKSESNETSGPVNSSSNKAKSVAQSDAELRERLEKMSGEGGAAGIEYEDGKPNAMKRGVRNNMFRLI